MAWLRLRPAPQHPHQTLRLAWIGINAADIEQRRTLTDQLLGQSDGKADQVFRLPLPQVESSSLQIEVEDPEGRGYQAWIRVDDLAAISADALETRDAPAYELDAAAGEIRFGDGVRGRVPKAGMRIRLASGRFGGGVAGNLPAGSLGDMTGRSIASPKAVQLKVHQPLAAEGGPRPRPWRRRSDAYPAGCGIAIGP